MVKQLEESIRFSWPPGPETLELPPGDVHIWGVEFDHESSAAPDLDQIELDRADRFHFNADRHRFIATRQALRRILAGYTGFRAADLMFEIGKWGKPSLCFEQQSIFFNVSHTRDVALIAVRADDEVGVDIEHQHSGIKPCELAQDILSASEMASYYRLDPTQKHHIFFEYWTAKEAYVKALGIGLNIDPRSVEVRLPDSKDQPGTCEAPQSSLSPYSLVQLPVDRPLHAAVATRGHFQKVRYYNASVA